MVSPTAPKRRQPSAPIHSRPTGQENPTGMMAIAINAKIPHPNGMPQQHPRTCTRLMISYDHG